MAGEVQGSQYATFTTLDAALASGDTEAVLMAFSIERAEFADKEVRDKITGMKDKNAQIANANAVMAMFSSMSEDDLGKDNKSITKSQADIDSMQQFVSTPEGKKFWEENYKGLDIKGTDKKADPSQMDWSKVTEIKTNKDGSDTGLSFKTKLQGHIDGLKSNEQLEMVELQRLVSLQNNSFEMASNLSKKYENTRSAVTRNMS